MGRTPKMGPTKWAEEESILKGFDANEFPAQLKG
jgi:hypothetical protein